MTDNKQRKVQAGWLSLFSFFENDLLQQTHCVTNFFFHLAMKLSNKIGVLSELSGGSNEMVS